MTIDATTDRLRAAAREFVAARAADLDAGRTSTRSDLSYLGAQDLFGRGCSGRPLGEMVAVLEDVSAESLSAGFSAWAHRMAIEYLDRAPETVRERFLPDLLAGRRAGVTAMAAGLKAVAGLGTPSLTATEVDGGLRVSGPIHWASNLFDDAVVVFCARVVDGDGGDAPAGGGGSERTVIAVAALPTEGVTVNPGFELLGLNSTASSSVTFDEVFIPADQVISTDLHGFVRAVRPTFLLLQTAFCAGITGESLRHSADRLTGLGAQFAAEHAELSREYESLHGRLYAYATAPDEVPGAELIRLRLDGSRLAGAATRLEVTLRGGAGYAVGSPTNRRFREAAFLPVQSPSEGQLRWELAHSS